MEVFSLKVDDDSGTNSPKVSGQGVVYCEMKGRQFSEADLLDLNLRRELCERFETDIPLLSRFKWECGGLTRDIATLSIEEIIAFHKCFYNPSNISIIICGKMCMDLEQSLLSLVDSIVKTSSAYGNSEPFVPELLSTNSQSPNADKFVKVVNFTASEDSLGSVGFAWLGADARDLTKVLSFHVLFKYLRETSSSPLYQEFVQIENPLATEIDYEIKPLFHTMMTLIFSGVPNNPSIESESGLSPGRIRSLLKECLLKISQDVSLFEKMIILCLQSFELKLIELIEDDPYETILSYTIPNLIAEAIDSTKAQEFGLNISNLKAMILDLKSKSIAYWISLLQELLACEPVEVIMVPDVKLNDEIDKQEVEYLSELYASGSARVSQLPDLVPYHIEGNFDLMTDSKMTPFKVNMSYSGLRLIELPGTGMKQIIRIFNFKRAIPSQLWPYLVLYQELLFQCDVDLSRKSNIKNLLLISEDIIPYQILQKTLNSLLNNYGINFGLENDTFSLGYCEEALAWTATLPSESKITLKDCLCVLECVATNSIFTEDRIKIVSENLYNQIQDLQKDPYEITESILTFKLHEMHGKTSLSNNKKVKIRDDQVFESSISIFMQKSFLKRISDGSPDVIEEALECLNEIKNIMTNDLIAAPSFVQIGSKSKIVESESSGLAGIKMDSGLGNFNLSDLPKFGHLAIEAGSGVAYAIGDITASYLSVVIPCNVLPSSSSMNGNMDNIRDYVSISLICQLMSVTEGPIYSAIRGRGLAYDASLSVSLWNGLLTFSVNDSNDPSAAYREFKSLMCGLNDEFESGCIDLISEDSLKVGKSAFLYQMLEETATPSSMFNCCFKSQLRSIPMGSDDCAEDPVRKVVESVTRTDLALAWNRYFQGFLGDKNEGVLAVLVVPRSVSLDVISKFDGMLDFELKSFKDFSSCAGNDSDSDDDESSSETDSCSDDSDDDEELSE